MHIAVAFNLFLHSRSLHSYIIFSIDVKTLWFSRLKNESLFKTHINRINVARIWDSALGDQATTVKFTFAKPNGFFLCLYLCMCTFSIFPFYPSQSSLLSFHYELLFILISSGESSVHVDFIWNNKSQIQNKFVKNWRIRDVINSKEFIENIMYDRIYVVV